MQSSNTLQGDHGGPLQCVNNLNEPWKLFGLTGYYDSQTCQKDKRYPRYTRVNREILDWIILKANIGTKV